jgi:acetyltransferase-like isoleucine patch superfamily enzyme
LTGDGSNPGHTSLPRIAWARTNALWRRATLAVRFRGDAISIDPSSWVAARSVIKVCGGGTIRIGRNCEIHPLSMILTYGGNIEIGDNCSLNPFAIVYGHGGVRIGNSVRIAAHTVIIPANHNRPSDDIPLDSSGMTCRGIIIDDNVWLGVGCRVLDGVHLSRNVIVGAGSVVSRSMPANATVAGVPARIIKARDAGGEA